MGRVTDVTLFGHSCDIMAVLSNPLGVLSVCCDEELGTKHIRGMDAEETELPPSPHSCGMGMVRPGWPPSRPQCHHIRNRAS
jgi:hypothetical protein